uniref:Uncharacterized protein n=1 Tax=Chelydra serpentina TaxID=8475 RepID=A0A8C3SM52_CHESE
VCSQWRVLESSSCFPIDLTESELSSKASNFSGPLQLYKRERYVQCCYCYMFICHNVIFQNPGNKPLLYFVNINLISKQGIWTGNFLTSHFY